MKELGLRGIDTIEAANAYAPEFMADFNARLASLHAIRRTCIDRWPITRTWMVPCAARRFASCRIPDAAL